MIRMLFLGMLLTGCVPESAPTQYGVPPSIQAGIWPGLYSRFRFWQPAQATKPAEAAPAQAAPVVPAPQVGTPPIVKIDETKIDEARRKLRELRQELNKPEPFKPN